MRYAFFITIFVLLQLFSAGAALSIQWWLQPWITQTLQTIVWSAVFIITNGLLVLSVKRVFANSYRWVSGWMLIMHFILLTALVVSFLYGGYWLVVSLIGETGYGSNTLSLRLRVLAVVVFLGLFIFSLYSAYVPIVRHLSISIDKPLAKPLRIAVASDLHLGRLFGVTAIDRLTRLMNSIRADMLLMPGDIMATR